jgi:hypothetical protein
VAFVGGGGFGVAWFALGPREPFYPAYHVSNAYIQRVNIMNVTSVNMTNISVANIRYANQSVPGAVIAAPQSTFAGARPVASEGRALGPQELAQARVISAAPVAPQRESVLGNGLNNAAVAHPPQTVMARQVVMKSQAPPPPVSFAAKQQALQGNLGRPLAPEQVQQIWAQQPAIVNRPAPLAQQAPINRMDSRPPNARPLNPSPVPAAPASPSAPQFNRSVPRAAPAAEPVNRPALQPAPGTSSESRPVNRPRQEETKAEKKKDEKKQ